MEASAAMTAKRHPFTQLHIYRAPKAYLPTACLEPTPGAGKPYPQPVCGGTLR
jgi:hypothetical protein